ncbi:hypothetical protein BDW69DRAFT_179414 [Aspergillus filifer]
MEVGWLAYLTNYSKVRSGKTLQAFAKKVIRLYQAAKITSSYNQMSMIWNRLEPNL